jgi:hypothetical protein
MSPVVLLGVMAAAYVALAVLVLRSGGSTFARGVWLFAGLVCSPLVLVVFLLSGVSRRTAVAES